MASTFNPRDAKFIEMMTSHDKLDPLVFAENAVTKDKLIGVKQPAPAHSGATLHRSKVINGYILKLQEDIKMLTAAKESLDRVKHQMDAEKVDTIVAERIAKQALAVVEDTASEELLATLIEEIGSKDSQENKEETKESEVDCAKILEESVQIPHFSNSCGGYFGHYNEVDDQVLVNDEEFMEKLRNGLDAPDVIPMVEEDELLGLN